MLNARKVQEFVIFISRSFLKYPRKYFFPFIYEYNISMVITKHACVYILALQARGFGGVVYPTCLKKFTVPPWHKNSTQAFLKYTTRFFSQRNQKNLAELINRAFLSGFLFLVNLTKNWWRDQFLVNFTKIWSRWQFQLYIFTKNFGKNYQNLVAMTIGIGRMTNFW